MAKPRVKTRQTPAASPGALPEIDRETLRARAWRLGVDLDAEQTDRLERFARLLVKWNAIHNLTAIDSADEIVTHHLLDSLAIVPELIRQTQNEPFRLLDAGSGGGLPGIPIAVVCPHAQITLLDAVQKKCTFLTQAQLELRLKNVRVVHARVEHWQDAPYDVIVSRAFSSIGNLVKWTRHLLRPDGLWMAMKGPAAQTELAELPVGVARVEVKPLDVPGLEQARTLVLLRPQ